MLVPFFRNKVVHEIVSTYNGHVNIHNWPHPDRYFDTDVLKWH